MRCSPSPMRRRTPPISSLHRFCRDRFCSSTGFPWSHSLLQTSPCSGVGSSRGCRWISAPPCPPGAAGVQPPLCRLHHGISALEPGAAPAPPSPLPWVSAELFLSHSHSSLAPAVVQYLLHFLKHVITELLPVLLKGSALTSSRSIMELGEASGIFSQKSPLQSTPSPKPCHTNLTLL